MIILFEGLNCTGKTTVRKMLSRMTDFEDVIFERGPASNIFYDRILGRWSPEREGNFFKEMAILGSTHDLVVIYLSCSEEDFLRRCNKDDGCLPHEVNNYNDMVKSYREFTKGHTTIINQETGLNPLFLEYNTTVGNPEQIVKSIVVKIREYKKEIKEKRKSNG